MSSSAPTDQLVIETEQSLALILSKAGCTSITATSLLNSGYNTIASINSAVNDASLINLLIQIGFAPADITKLKDYFKQPNQQQPQPAQQGMTQHSLTYVFQRAEPSAQVFWEHLQTLKVDPNSILRLPSGVHFLGNEKKRSSLFIRKCYVKLKELIFADFTRYESTLSPSTTPSTPTSPPATSSINSAFVVTGNPGIGKSVFIYYMMWVISQMKATIVVRSYHSDTKDAYYVYTYDQHVKPVVLRTLSHSDVLPHLKDKKTFYLVDSLDVSNHAAKTIVVSSPDPSKYKEFLKDADSTRRYLPPWKKRELDTVRPLLYPSVTQVELDQLWNKWGGIPRFVLEKAHDQEFQRTLDQVIPTLDLDLCVKSVGQEDTQAPGSHKVIQIIPRDVPGFAKYSQMELRFSSKYVARIVVRETEKLHMDRITKELTVPRFLHSPLGGSFFEGVVHRKLQVGGTFKRRLLNNNNTGKESDVVIPKPLPSVDIKSINDISKPSSATGAYLLPTYSNFPVVDSLIKPTQLFQVTVSSTHPPLMQELSNIVDQLGNPPNVDLYFVVPEDMYSDFKQSATKLSKQVQTVTQYVLLFTLASNQ
ncbi:hypothetical protein DFA_07019 [Cavenderia fasciculata]|uniref:Uncharacterized protein n=1 Tax=Cavenderia fasciculata TaxID=261658 RepID=F4PXA9_CACFS|nr:uncharacterized protein DFA_07019 [Cavenderia fasciculata]EGG19912.1 hypothetical protein DFA_07019 [Cavenderia fasciculata]|eukprot:XP_004366895.1 hypothetical protein DFA_07019 [Cavenderia fasciculata]